jgi:hypothetical protein
MTPSPPPSLPPCSTAGAAADPADPAAAVRRARAHRSLALRRCSPCLQLGSWQRPRSRARRRHWRRPGLGRRPRLAAHQPPAHQPPAHQRPAHQRATHPSRRSQMAAASPHEVSRRRRRRAPAPAHVPRDDGVSAASGAAAPGLLVQGPRPSATSINRQKAGACSRIVGSEAALSGATFDVVPSALHPIPAANPAARPASPHPPRARKTDPGGLSSRPCPLPTVHAARLPAAACSAAL